MDESSLISVDTRKTAVYYVFQAQKYIALERPRKSLATIMNECGYSQEECCDRSRLQQSLRRYIKKVESTRSTTPVPGNIVVGTDSETKSTSNVSSLGGTLLICSGAVTAPSSMI